MKNPTPALPFSGEGAKESTPILSLSEEVAKESTPILPLSGEGAKESTPILPLSGEVAKESTPILPLSEERVEAQRGSVVAPPPGKGEAGRGSRLLNLKYQKSNRQQLRKNPTEPERRFWSWVRAKQLSTKFRRQHGIGRYIVDYYCAEYALIVEIDGDSHYDAEAIAYDATRTEFLMAKGFRVVRFTNREIMQNKEGVLIKLVQYITENDRGDEQLQFDRESCNE